jgi:FMN phosphatase YigB (HAD superfamily)
MDAVILDIDGTLLQSNDADDELYLAAVRQVLGGVRLRASWGMYTHVTDTGILQEVLCDNALDATSSVVASVRECFVASVGRHVAAHGPFKEVPGARAFVQSLCDSGTHRVAYATGGWFGSAWLKLSAAGFPLHGVPLASSDDHTERQAIMLHALRQLDGDFRTITYYGDGQWDEVAARGLGWQFTPVGEKLGGLTKFRPLPPDYVFGRSGEG